MGLLAVDSSTTCPVFIETSSLSLGTQQRLLVSPRCHQPPILSLQKYYFLSNVALEQCHLNVRLQPLEFGVWTGEWCFRMTRALQPQPWLEDPLGRRRFLLRVTLESSSYPDSSLSQLRPFQRVSVTQRQNYCMSSHWTLEWDSWPPHKEADVNQSF